MNRCSGILMPVFSLPSPYGIGTLGKAAYDFADFLHAAGQRCWQMLPLGPTSYGDSPYQSFSTYAGNPYFIDLELLIEDGLLTRDEVESQNWGTNPRYVDYGKIYESRFAVLQKAKDRGVQLLLPTDTVAAAEFSADADSLVVPTDAIPDDMEGLDIGPETIRTFCAAVRGAGTVVWNGPMGVFEFEKFAAGTRAMAQALADSGAITIVGGGDSAAAVEQMGFADKITHISTGGGASLEFLEGIELPGVACLLDK